MIYLTPEEINELEVFIKGCALCVDPVMNEYRKEQLLVLCRTAIRYTNGNECVHRWIKDGIVTRCDKCSTIA